MRLTSRSDPQRDGKIIGIEYRLPNGQYKKFEEHVSSEALYKIDPSHYQKKLYAMAEHDIRRNMATNDQHYTDSNQLMANPYGYGQLASALGGAGLGSWTTTTATADWSQLAQAYPTSDQLQQYRNPPITRMMKFFRVNTPVEMIEGAKFSEPLDELRWKVAKWLKRN